MAKQVCIKYCHIFFPISYKPEIETWCFGILNIWKASKITIY